MWDFIRYFLDKRFVNRLYLNRFGKKINWENPTGYNEKIQIFKITKEAEKLWPYVDKFEVRKFVTQTIGSEYLVKLYHVYNSVDEIDFSALPNSFVLKTTHGSGWNILCPDKNQFDISATKQQLSIWLKQNYYRSFGKERQYKKIPPRIVCEEYLQPTDGDLKDYKFFCFHGVPRVIQLDSMRQTNHHRNFYDPSWNLLPLRIRKPLTTKEIKRPKNLDQMLEIVHKLSKPFNMVRVDLYDVDGKIYFGELTFTPGNGTILFSPSEWDTTFGSYLK